MSDKHDVIQRKMQGYMKLLLTLKVKHNEVGMMVKTKKKDQNFGDE